MRVSKCDVIVPVYNAPDWLKLCVYSIFINTPLASLGKVYLINDCSDALTTNCIANLKEKYSEHIEVVHNKKNLGFVKSVNKGLRLSKSKYVLLLNTDCLISKNTIIKLMNHMEMNSRVGLISPIASNAANLTLEIFEGFSYTQMDALLYKRFKGKTFDACTVVGNCLMISRKCINEVGLLDEMYGMGYGEETDYQFKAMSKGFDAKVAIDTYVFHKAEVSFGNSEEKAEKINKNRDIFFNRWETEYRKEIERYSKKDPIKYIKDNLKESDYIISVDTLFYLPQLVQNAGGCHVVLDIVNYLVINSKSANVLYESSDSYNEILLFNPIKFVDSLEVKVKRIVGTIWFSTLRARKLARRLKVPIINLVQGYENYFENGNKYNSVTLSHRIADQEITISKYLKDKLNEMFDIESTLIENGVNLDLFYKANNSKKAKTITLVFRNNPMKGDYILADILHILDRKFSNLNINVVYMSEYIEIPFVHNNKVNKILGPISRFKMAEVLQSTDIYIDASINEGFGLIGLEAMSCGAVPVMSNSFGITAYLEDGINGFIVDNINDVSKYIDKVSYLIENPNVFIRLKNNALETVSKFDYDDTIKEYIDFFENCDTQINRSKTFHENEWDLVISYDYIYAPIVTNQPRGLRYVKRISKMTPNSAKKRIKRIIDWLYRLYGHD